MELLADIENLDAKEIMDDDLFSDLVSEENEISKTNDKLKLFKRAKDVGVLREFKMKLSAYEKEKKKFDKEKKVVPFRQDQSGNVTEFGDEYPELNCGGWVANMDGVSILTMFGEKKACNHPILIKNILINNETNLCKATLCFYVRSKWHEIVVDKEAISSSTKIVSLSKFGIQVTSENAKYLVQYLSELESLNEDKIEEQVSTSRVGWFGKNFVPYYNDVIFDNETNLSQLFDSICAEGSEEKWLEIVKEIRNSDRFEPKIYMAASLASVLIEPIGALPFIINLYGSAGKGKTVALMLASSIWADPGENRYISDPKSTEAALEVRMDFLKNLPVLLDDMAQIKLRPNETFANFIYYLCSGKGKERSNRQLGLNKVRTWHNCILTNGEHPLLTATIQGGAVARTIDVEIDDGYIFENGNKVAETLRNNYGFCGKDFINLIQLVGIDKIKEKQKDYYNKIYDYSKSIGQEKEEKQILPMSLIMTADFYATKYIFEDENYLDFERCVSLLKSVCEVSENERCYQFLIDEIAINVNKFEPDEDGNYKSECWGMIENGIAIIIGSQFDKIMKNEGFDSKTFLSWAAKKKLILTGEDGRYKKVKRFGEHTVRCVHLKMKKNQDEFCDASDEITPFDCD